MTNSVYEINCVLLHDYLKWIRKKGVNMEKLWLKMILKKHTATTLITIEFKNDDYDHLVFHDKKIFL